MENQAGTGELPGVSVPLSKVLAIQRREVAAVASVARGRLDEAIKIMEKATALEESVSPLRGCHL
jgi:hypothetical protein